MSGPKTPVIGHVTPLTIAGTATNDEPAIIPRGRRVAAGLCEAADRAWETLAQARARMDVKTYPPATLQRLQAELEEAEVLRPGSTWTGPDGTTYDVVRAEDVGDRPRWWIPVGLRGDQVGLEEPGELHTDAAPGGAGMLLALVRRAHGVRDAAAFSLESARAMLANLEHLPPDVSADDARVDLWVELREACDEVERLRARVSGLEVDLAAIREAIEAHLPEHSGDLVARIANASAVIAGARASRDAYQQEARAAERRLTEERSARIDAVQRLERTEATLRRWQARARKAEARVAVLTEERDGLTLRLGEKVAKVNRRPSVTVRRGCERNVAVRMTGGGGGGGTGQRAKPARTRKGGR